MSVFWKIRNVKTQKYLTSNGFWDETGYLWRSHNDVQDFIDIFHPADSELVQFKVTEISAKKIE